MASFIANIEVMDAQWSLLLQLCLVSMISLPQILRSEIVNKTLLESAVAKGAVCLDGSPPAYYYAKGFDDGVSNWLVHLEGGAWCASELGCNFRQTNHLGSSKYKPNATYFGAMLSEIKTINPDFYNWNRIYVGYCDGSSFTGDVQEIDPLHNITRRGARIFDAVVHDLLAKGMENASMAMLSGDSAGGLAAILHCDGFRALLPNARRVKCISDAGFFLLAENLYGADERANYFAEMVEYHGIAKFLPKSCTSKMNASLCIFPEYIVKDICTPLFLLQSAFDSYQLMNHNFSKVDQAWGNCTADLTRCNCSHLQTMQDFRKNFIEDLKKVRHSSSVGVFVDSCYSHTHVLASQGWDKSTVLKNKTIAMAIGDWYFDRSSFHQIDTKHTCPQNCTLTESPNVLCKRCKMQDAMNDGFFVEHMIL